MFARLFIHHPAKVGESYFEHMAFAGWFAFKLAQASLAALVHALVPGLCEKTASTIIAELYGRTQGRT